MPRRRSATSRLWLASSDTPKIAQTALSVKPEVRTFLTDYMKNLPGK